jgi:chaperone required for assembly of F1-ATPase
MDLRKGFHEPVEKPRKFYKSVSVAEEEGGFAVKLDGRNVRSPKGGKLVAPTRALAELVAEEWAAQTDVIELATMHATRLAFTAAEAIPQAREATADQVASYAGSDLLCYFAQDPSGLVERQTSHWGPMLERAERELALMFVRASGIIHQAQPPETLAKVKALALELEDYGLAGLAFGTSLFGSAVLAFAIQRGWVSGEQAWELSRLDEAYQEEKWGVDEEAAERNARLRLEAVMLERWFKALA